MLASLNLDIISLPLAIYIRIIPKFIPKDFKLVEIRQNKIQCV